MFYSGGFYWDGGGDPDNWQQWPEGGDMGDSEYYYDYDYEYGGGGGAETWDWEGLDIPFESGGGGLADPVFDIGYTIGVDVWESSMPEAPAVDPYAPDITQVFSGIEVPDIYEAWPNELGLPGGGLNFEAPDITAVFSDIEVPDIFGVPVVTGKDVGLPQKSIWDKIADFAKGIGIGGGSGSGGGSAGGGSAAQQKPAASTASMLPWILAGGAALMLLTSKGGKR